MYQSSPGIAATASPLGRETEELRLANLAARVAAAARRVARGKRLDPQRDESVLAEIEQILRTGAASLDGDSSELSGYRASRQTSYAFARLTNSVLNTPPRRPDGHDELTTRRAAAQTLRELADDVRDLLVSSDDPRSVVPTAQRVEMTFNRISSNVLSSLGRPGDSLAGIDLGSPPR
jgi:hypothetical protein